MKLRDRIDTVKQIPTQIKAASKAVAIAMVVAILAFVMAGIALINGGVRYAN